MAKATSGRCRFRAGSPAGGRACSALPEGMEGPGLAMFWGGWARSRALPWLGAPRPPLGTAAVPRLTQLLSPRELSSLPTLGTRHSGASCRRGQKPNEQRSVLASPTQRGTDRSSGQSRGPEDRQRPPAFLPPLLWSRRVPECQGSL